METPISESSKRAISALEQPGEGRFARNIRLAGQIKREPRTIVSLARGWFIRQWLSRGGGMYGLGYAVTFVLLEIRALTDDISGSESVTGFVAYQVFGFVIRFSIESFVNLILALLWPVLLLQQLEVWAIPVLITAFAAFQYGVRPYSEARIPELREARRSRLSPEP